MPQTYPETPRFATPTERSVWIALRDQLASDDLVIHGQRITDHEKDHEADFVVAIAGAGVVCIEVKGGEVWHDGDSWWQARAGAPPKRIDPVAQARGACYALRSFVESHPAWTQGRVRWDHAVVLPQSRIDSNFAIPDCPRWKIIDRDQLDELVPLLRRVLLGKRQDLPHIAAPAVEQLTAALSGCGLPQRDVVARSLENEAAADTLTEQQAVLLNAIRLLNRVEIRGGPGSGKTFLAAEQARRLTKAGQRVALICYSHGLASYLARLVRGWKYNERPAYVGEFHQLGVKWGAAAGPDESIISAEAQRFWEHELPNQMAELAEALEPGHRFDAIVIDEAQDFADEWWQPMLACLRDPDDSGVYVFSDEAQRVFDRQGVPPVPLVPLVLDQNLRNTRQIASTFSPLAGQRMHLRGGDGPDVRFVPCSAVDALVHADDQIDLLIDEGWRPQDIALLTTGSRHNEQVARQQEGPEAYWDTFWDDDQVFYGHVLGFKGLERCVVVLALNESKARDRSKERLYVGLSRARDQLVVCGDPDFVRDVGGPDVARRLIPTAVST
ncbi:NERD domain-containing protein [Gordonia sp. DT30]|uniref:nuclease-related domain-containing DEAD/DEAH box helicase n=1 Tax=Gordonia sp. DT30 TaxID=3416546 RepID=UPI003CECC47A